MRRLIPTSYRVCSSRSATQWRLTVALRRRREAGGQITASTTRLLQYHALYQRITTTSRSNFLGRYTGCTLLTAWLTTHCGGILAACNCTSCGLRFVSQQQSHIPCVPTTTLTSTCRSSIFNPSPPVDCTRYYTSYRSHIALQSLRVLLSPGPPCYDVIERMKRR